MEQPFFPGPLFGWAFWLVLMGLLAVAAYLDWRTFLVPKKLTLTALSLGLVFNLVRGIWLGLQGQQVWALGPGGPAVGAADGLLFALAGFGLGFGLFFLMWILGVCGGGDVKLFAALGAWVGPTLTVSVLVGTLVVVLLVTVLRLVCLLPAGFFGWRPAPGRESLETGGKARRRPRLLTYSLPVAISTALVLLWVLRGDLGLATPRPPLERVEVHGR